MATIGTDNVMLVNIERKYFDVKLFKKLLKDPKEKAMHEELVNTSSVKQLAKRALGLAKALESGELTIADAEVVKWRLMHLIGAIKYLERIQGLENVPTM